MRLIIYYKFFTNTNKRTFKKIKNDKVHVSESHQFFLFLHLFVFVTKEAVLKFIYNTFVYICF